MGVSVSVAVGEGVSVGVGVRDGVRVNVGVREGVNEAVGVSLGAGVGVNVTVGRTSRLEGRGPMRLIPSRSRRSHPPSYCRNSGSG